MGFDNSILKGQATIFDFIQDDEEPEGYELVKAIIDDDICSGTGFQNGKQRVIEFFKNNTDKNERIKFLKNEYGIGGHTITRKGEKVGFQSHNANGIDFEFTPIIGKTVASHIGYMMLEQRIQRLINEGKYKC